MITCVRKLQFCAGHRVMRHEGKCANPHGHNYVAFFHAQAPELDGVGRVVDFSILKEKLGAWIDTNWDHKFIAYTHDMVLREALSGFPVFFIPYNPTAENMAFYLLNQVCPYLFRDNNITIVKIVLWETENCFVEVTL